MKKIYILLLLLTAGLTNYSQQTQFYSANGSAIKGYDVVAYFTQNKALEGSDNYVANWSNTTWKFTSQSNLDSFNLHPEKYAPQYGGYCAYGCSENHKSPTDPKAFTIINNKLYLNYNLKVKEFWIKETDARIKSADENWPALNQ